jgi:Regulator of chromosome condensation (RCC1) repeat
MLRVSAPRHPHVTPVLAVGLERVRIVSIAAGHAHTCCIDSEGGLHTMGYNDRGQVVLIDNITNAVSWSYAANAAYAAAGSGCSATTAYTVASAATFRLGVLCFVHVVSVESSVVLSDTHSCDRLPHWCIDASYIRL